MGFGHVDFDSPPLNEMNDNMAYSNTAQHKQPPYYPTPAHVPTNLHLVAPPPQQESTQRKRPKYTRSKTGCLTCRIKKIKCDETKPACIRCTHGQRDCTWPEGIPGTKKPSRRSTMDEYGGRPSTAGSSGVSEASTPPTRNHTPPNGTSLPLLIERRHTEPYPRINPVAQQPEYEQRQSTVHVDTSINMQGYSIPQANSNAGVMSIIPETPIYPQEAVYDHNYSTAIHSAPQPSAPRRGPTNNQHHVNDHFIGQPAPIAPWNQPIMPSLDPIEPFFHNAQERNLIRHYCDNSMSIIMAVPSENPIVAANLPLVLGRPRGSDPSTEALRMALLGVAAIHQSYLLARCSSTSDGAQAMQQIAHQYRTNSKLHLAKACSTVVGTQSDASLAASLTIALIDIFFGGRNWSKNLDLAKTLVRVRGGPANLLSRSSTSSPGFVEGKSRNRLFLEILAVYELAGCLSTGREPSILDNNENNWWLDETHPKSSWVESVFGISRPFVALLARVTTFLSRAAGAKITAQKFPDEATDIKKLKECHEFYNALESWTHPIPNLPARVHTGNTIYAKAIQIMLLREIMLVEPTNSIVQGCAQAILSLCHECTKSKMGLDLVWPVIIAGSNMYGANRNTVLDVLEAFRLQCCYEIDTSEMILQQVWKRRDQCHPRAEWRHVTKDFDINPLIM